jgi:hypothetical protein
MSNIQKLNYMEEKMLYRPVTKCKWCGAVYEPKTNSSSIELLASHTYVHQCDIRYQDRGIAELIGYTIEASPKKELTTNESDRIQNHKVPVEPKAG